MITHSVKLVPVHGTEWVLGRGDTEVAALVPCEIIFMSPSIMQDSSYFKGLM